MEPCSHYFTHIGAKKTQVSDALMNFKQAYHISTSRAAVWQALNDTEVLAKTIPGCRKIVWISDANLEAEIAVNLGIAKPAFKGDLLLSNVDPAVSYTLTGRGRGGIFGRAEGAADIVLSDEGEGTRLAFSAHGSATGQVAKLGASLLGAQAEKLIDGFFARFGKAMNAEVIPLHD